MDRVVGHPALTNLPPGLLSSATVTSLFKPSDPGVEDRAGDPAVGHHRYIMSYAY